MPPAIQAQALPRHDGARLVGSLTCGAIALASLRKVLDPDLFWHMRTGRWIWENRAIPREDPFSYASDGRWEFSDSLASLFFYAGEVLRGTVGVQSLTLGLVLVLAAVVLAPVRAACRSSGASPRVVDAVSAITLALWGAAAGFRLGPKADLFSFLGFAGVLAVASHSEERRDARWLALLIPLFALWSNCHRGGTIGWFALALVALSWRFQPTLRFLALPAAGATLLSGAALLLNPLGIRYVTAAFDVTARASFRVEFPEWAAMSASFLWSTAPAFTVLALLAVVGAVGRRRIRAPELLALSTTALAVYSVRFAAFAAIALAPLAAETLVSLARRIPPERFRGVRPGLATPAALAVALIVVGVDYARTVPPAYAGLGLAWWRLPVQASEFLRENPPPGRLWNSFNFGGYLIYALGPARQVLIDGRNDTVYSKAGFEEAMRAGREPAVFAAQVARFDVTTAIVECKSLTCTGMPWLSNDPGWALVYWDDRALVFVRRSPETAAYVARFAYRTLRPGDALARAALGDRDAAAPELEEDALRYVREVPSSLRAQYLVARVHRTRGRDTAYRAARARFVALAEERGVTIPPP